MTNISEALYKKMSEELATRKKEMAKESSEDIINGFIPYELVYKEDLLSCFEEDYMNLKNADYDFLFSLEKPLEWLYVQWLDSDNSHMELLETFIVNTMMLKGA